MIIEKLMIDNGITQGEILEQFGIPERTALKWRKNPSPSNRRLIELLIWLVRLDELRMRAEEMKK